MTPPIERDYMGADDDTELRLGLPGSDGRVVDGGTPVGLTLGGAKRAFSVVIHGAGEGAGGATKTAPPLPAAKTQIVGWPPIHSHRKNTIASNTSKNAAAAAADDDDDTKRGNECHYVKVGMDGVPYLRKVNLNTYSNYKELSLALEEMFTRFAIGQCGSNGEMMMITESRVLDLLRGSEHVLTYEDKDGDWMLVGDVPWLMFADSCRRLRIMKSSDTVGIGEGGAPKVMGSKNRN